MRHTPGPWNTSLGSVRTNYLVEGEHHKLIANVYGNNEADARLIAAAPDLLDALSDALQAIASLDAFALGIGGEGVTHWSIRDELLAKIDRAIIKATGEPNAADQNDSD